MKFKNYIETESGIKDTSSEPGTAGQVLSSTVTGTSWIGQKEITAGSATVVTIECKNTHTTPLTKGTPVYQTGTVGATDVIEIAPGNALVSAGAQPSIGLLQQDLAINEFGYVIITGELLNITTDPIDGLTPVTGQKVFVKSGGGLTLTKPTTELNSIQNMGLVGKVSGGNAGSITVSSIMRTNDVPNLPTGRIWIGDGNTIVSDTVYVDEPNGRVGIGTTIPQAKLHVANGTLRTWAPTSGTSAIFESTVSNRNFVTLTAANEAELWFGDATTQAKGRIRYEISDGLLNFERMEFWTNAIERMVIDGSGKLGIGVENPQEKMHLSGSSNVRLEVEATDSTVAALKLTNTAGSYGSFVNASGSLNTYDYNAASVRTTLLTNGNFGIGTTIPQAKLHVEDATPKLKILSNQYYNSSIIEMGNGARPTAGLITCSNNPGISALELLYDNGSTGDARIRVGQRYLDFQIDAVSGMYINSSKNVGIGTTGPGAKLDVASGDIRLATNSTYFRVKDAASAQPRVLGMNSANTFYIGPIDSYAGGAIVYGASANVLYHGFYGGGSEKMRISAAGNVGIGTTSPNHKLEVTGNMLVGGGSSNYLYINNTANFLYGDAYGNTIIRSADNFRIQTKTGGGESVRVTSAGNVGIGTTVANVRLEIGGGSSLARVIPSVDNEGYIGDSQHRWQAIYATYGAIVTSDIREKTEIKPTKLGLDFINDLTPVSYKWIEGERLDASKDERNHHGLIAQEVAKTLEKHGVDKNKFGGLDIQKTDEYDDFHAMSYEQLIAPMIKAIQELKAEIEELKKTNK